MAVAEREKSVHSRDAVPGPEPIALCRLPLKTGVELLGNPQRQGSQCHLRIA